MSHVLDAAAMFAAREVTDKVLWDLIPQLRVVIRQVTGIEDQFKCDAVLSTALIRFGLSGLASTINLPDPDGLAKVLSQKVFIQIEDSLKEAVQCLATKEQYADILADCEGFRKEVNTIVKADSDPDLQKANDALQALADLEVPGEEIVFEPTFPDCGAGEYPVNPPLPEDSSDLPDTELDEPDQPESGGNDYPDPRNN